MQETKNEGRRRKSSLEEVTTYVRSLADTRSVVRRNLAASNAHSLAQSAFTTRSRRNILILGRREFKKSTTQTIRCPSIPRRKRWQWTASIATSTTFSDSTKQQEWPHALHQSVPYVCSSTSNRLPPLPSAIRLYSRSCTLMLRIRHGTSRTLCTCCSPSRPRISNVLYRRPKRRKSVDPTP